MTRQLRTRQSGDYADTLRRLTSGMAARDFELLRTQLADDADQLGLQMFVDANLDKRCDKLLEQLEFVAPAFDDLESLVVAYAREVALSAYAAGVDDGDRFLAWLECQGNWTDLQWDHICCQRARHAVEQLAEQHRDEYLQFHHLSVRTRGETEWTSPSGLWMYLNPIRVWTRFRTPELVEGAADELPVNALLFPVDGQIRTAVLELEGQALINELADFSPCAVNDWAAVSSWRDPDELRSFCRDLAELGLLALG